MYHVALVIENLRVVVRLFIERRNAYRIAVRIADLVGGELVDTADGYDIVIPVVQ